MTKLLIASGVMGAFIGFCAWQYPLMSRIFWRKEVAVIAVAVGGVVVYGIAALLLRAITLSELKGALRREKGAPGVSSGPDLG